MPSTSVSWILPTTGVLNQRILQVQLIAPNIHKSIDSVTVKVTVAVDVSYANSNDQDPFIGISDGKSSIGFNAADTYTHPCHIMQENSENTILTVTNGKDGYCSYSNFTSLF